MSFEVRYAASSGRQVVTRDCADDAIMLAMDFLNEGRDHVEVRSVVTGVTFNANVIRTSWAMLQRSRRGKDNDVS